MRIIQTLILFLAITTSQAQVFVAADATGNNDGTSWMDAFTSLQAGINAAATATPAQVWVKQGVYKTLGSSTTDLFSLIDGVSLYGGFDGTETNLTQRNFQANETILSGNIGDPNDITDNNNIVLRVFSTSLINRIDGIVVEDGYNNLATGPTTWGTINIRDAEITISNCVFRNNNTNSGLGAVIGLTNSSLVLDKCNMLNNTATNVLVGSNNTTKTIQVSNSLFTGNGGPFGKVFFSIFSSGYTVLFTNNTVANNTAGMQSGAMSFGVSANYYLRNNIHVNNNNNPSAEPNVTLENNIIEGTALPNNFDIDPGFNDPVNGDFSLSVCSGARNLGNNTFLPTGITEDIEGNTRIFAGTVDIGAYEVQAFPIQINAVETLDVPCFGEATGQISLGTTGGSGTLEYSLDGTNFSSNAIFSGLSSDSYTVTVRDANGCTETANTMVNELALAALQVSATPSDATCFGAADGEILISGSGGTSPYTYSIDGTTFTPVGTILDNLAAGSYAVTLRDVNGCEDNVTVAISQPDELSLTTSVTNISCNGQNDGEISLSASGGTIGYEFSIDGTNFSTSTSFSNLAGGSYTVSVRDANNCHTTESITIIEPDELTGSLSKIDITCNGADDGIISFESTGGTGTIEASLDGTSYQTTAFINLSPSTYTVIIRDANGCTIQLAETISEPAAISATITKTDLECPGDNDGTIAIVATGGTAPLEYSVDGSTFQSTSDFSGLTGGSYTVSVRDANSCELSETISISEPAAFDLNATITNVSCNGESNGSIVLTATGGAGSYEYSIDGTNFSASGDFSGLSASTYSISLIDGVGCIYSEDIVISEPNELTIAASFDGSQVNLTVSGGIEPYEYSVDGTTFQSETTFILGNGNYTFTVRDANLCMASSQESTLVTSTDSNNERIVSVYPNPINDKVFIESSEKIQMIWVINSNGKLMKYEYLNGNEIKLDMSVFTNGVYLLEVFYQSGDVEYKRVLKQ